MARKNGGIIGPANIPTGNFGSAPGVWSLTEVKKYINEGIWPVATSGFQVQNSLRFDDGSSDYLSRTPASAGNRQTFTISFWYKRTTPGTSGSFIRADNGTGQDGGIRINTDSIQFFDNDVTLKVNLQTTQVLRDVSAWYHIMCVADTTNATSGDRALIYLNGSRVTDLSSATYPTQNLDFASINNSSFAQNIGRSENFATYLDGYLAEFVFIDGQALTPSSFGETDATTGNWVPKDVSGLTFGTNGFYLPFQNAAALGQDDSGNGNNFTVNNLTSIDQTTDTPTNNFATLNPLDINPSNTNTFANGNTTITTNGNGARSNLGASIGKYYAEVKYVNNTSFCGIMDLSTAISSTSAFIKLFGNNNGQIFVNGSLTDNNVGAGTAIADNSIIMFAMDLDNNRLYIGKNGLWWTSGSGFVSSSLDSYKSFTNTNSNFWGFVATTGSGSPTSSWNFGNPPYTISSGNTDFGGLGNFEYEVPSGYRALCTKNIGLVG